MPTNANDLMPEGFNGEINYNDDGTININQNILPEDLQTVSEIIFDTISNCGLFDDYANYSFQINIKPEIEEDYPNE